MNIDDFLSFRQIAMQVYRTGFEGLIKKSGLTQMEIDILLFLGNNPKYDTARSIVEIRHLTKSHVSSSIDSLVKRGLLIRQNDPSNQKLIHLKLTSEANSLFAEGRLVQQYFFTALLDGISPQEQRMLTEIFEKMNQNLKKAQKRKEDH